MSAFSLPCAGCLTWLVTLHLTPFYYKRPFFRALRVEVQILQSQTSLGKAETPFWVQCLKLFKPDHEL